MFPFQLSLNTSTLFPYQLDIREQIRVAAEAGYKGIEIWVRDLETYLAHGGTVNELRSHIDHLGITIVNAIAFWPWSDEDEAARAAGLEQAKRELTLLADLGCAAAAAPPFGNVGNVPLTTVATFFSDLVNIARSLGVEPYLEFWGRAKTLSRLSEAVYVAMESGVQNAKILLDPFHMYTGGSHLDWLTYLRGDGIGIVHVNDYPASPDRSTITDKDRVFPGEGMMPSQLFGRQLYESGYRGYLSLELFIEDYGHRSALDMAKQGIDAIRGAYSL